MKQFFHIEAKGKQEAEVFLYGDVSRWNELNGLTLHKKLKELHDQGYKKATLRINSPGGSIMEGVAMYTAIKNAPLQVHVKIDGMAASMASALAMGADHVAISEHARLMIHQGHGGVMGSAKQIKTYGELLDSLNRSLAEIYSQKTGKEVDWIIDNWMAEGKDTWFTAKKALKEGLVDEVFKGKVKQAPDGNAEWMDMAAHYTAALDTEETETQKAQKMTKEEILKALNLPEDATDEQINAAIAKARNEDSNMDALVALAESKGMDVDLIKLAAKADFNGTLEKVKAYKAPEKEEKKEEGKKEGQHESIADALAKLLKGTQKEEAKKFEDYSLEELEKMKAEDNARYEKLIKSRYGKSVSELSSTYD